jgi:methylated-DNA-[protein]-cysteine S-methyltransferase
MGLVLCGGFGPRVRAKMRAKVIIGIKIMAQIQFKMDSKIGPLYLVASDKGLMGIFWTRQTAPMAEKQNFQAVIDEVTEYLDGKRKKFDLPLDVVGTEFQKRVWKELLKIPYGKTVSYQSIANKIGTNGVRAVGSAIGKNPLCIVIPCHRVIASNGGLGGYSGGLTIKKALLSMERS